MPGAQCRGAVRQQMEPAYGACVGGGARVSAEVPPRVEYRLTDSGRSLLPIIHQLTDWALANMPRVLAHRRAYESNIQLSQAEAEV